MYGTENIKNLLEFAFKFGLKLDEVLEDKHVTWIEVVGFAPVAAGIPALIKNAKEIKNEFLDLDETEQTDIKNYFKQKFDIANDKIEEFVEKAFAWLLATADLVEAGLQLKN